MTLESASVTILKGDRAVDFVSTWRPERSTTEFVTPEWILASWEHLPEIGKPMVLVAEESSRWCAVALAESTAALGPSLALAGAPLGDEHDVHSSHPECAQALTSALASALERMASAGAEVRLDALSARGHLARALSVTAGRWSLHREPAPVIDMAHMRVNPSGHARRIRRLSPLGPVAFDIVDGARLTAAEGETFVRRRIKSWERRGRLQELPAVEGLPSFPRFMGAMMSRLAQRDMARIRLVTVGGTTVAEDLYLGPVTDPLIYMRSYDPEFQIYSPGRILLEEGLLDMASSSIERLRTGRGDEAYKLAAGARNEYVLTALPESQPT